MNKILLQTLLIITLCSKVYGQKNDVYIKAGQFYNSEKNILLKNKAIKINGNTIAAVGNFDIIPEGSKIIDLTEYTVLPGLIDAHTHVLFSQTANDDFSEHNIEMITMEGDALRVLRGAKRAQSYLDVGITSIKDLGNSGLFLDVALRDAINEGTIQGPRIFASGPILASIGGQIYDVNYKHQHIINEEYRIIKDKNDAINAVREHVNQNVDIIKICADNLPNKTFLSIDEIKAIVQTAHEYNLTVTAHTVTNQSAWNAIRAGVDGIEHGFNIEDSTLILMAQNNIYLVPTENSRKYMNIYAKLSGSSENELDWIDFYMEAMEKRLKRAIGYGVPIVAGSDNYTEIGMTRGESSKDMFRFYFEAGMKPLDILRSATYLSAVYLNKEKDIGSLIPGAKADIIAVKGDIEKDFLNTLNNIVLIIKDGEIYLQKAY